jgi:hypothetical protein
MTISPRLIASKTMFLFQIAEKDFPAQALGDGVFLAVVAVFEPETGGGEALGSRCFGFVGSAMTVRDEEEG